MKAGRFYKRKRRLLSKRLDMIFLWFVLFASVISSRLVSIQIYEHNRYKKSLEQQSERLENIAPLRGEIRDRNGITLAIDLESRDLFLRRGFDHSVEGIKRDLELLSKYMDKDYTHIVDKISNQYSLMIERGILNSRFDLHGFLQEVNYIGSMRSLKRHYPWGRTSSTLIGFTGVDHIGLEGIEYAYDSHLAGRSGKQLIGVDARGARLRFLGMREPAIDGKNLNLTIDILLTKYLHGKLQDILDDRKNEESLFLSIIDLDRQELVSSVSLPNFDPNDISGVESARMRNRNIHQIFSPSYALDFFFLLSFGKIKEDDFQFLECETQPYTYFDAKGTVDRFYSKVGGSFAHDFALEFLKDLGFGDRVNIDYVGQDVGAILERKLVDKNADVNDYIGDAVICNPLQIASLYVQTILGSKFEIRSVRDSTLGTKYRTKNRDHRLFHSPDVADRNIIFYTTNPKISAFEVKRAG